MQIRVPEGKQTQIIFLWQSFCSVLQIFLFQFSPPLFLLDLYVFEQTHWVNQRPIIFLKTSHEEEKVESHQMILQDHHFNTIPISMTTSTWWALIFTSPLTLETHLSIWQQNSGSRDSFCSFNITLHAVVRLLKAVSFTYRIEYIHISEQGAKARVSCFCSWSNMNCFAHWDCRERQHSAKF